MLCELIHTHARTGVTGARPLEWCSRDHGKRMDSLAPWSAGVLDDRGGSRIRATGLLRDDVTSPFATANRKNAHKTKMREFCIVSKPTNRAVSVR